MYGMVVHDETGIPPEAVHFILERNVEYRKSSHRNVHPQLKVFTAAFVIKHFQLVRPRKPERIERS